MLKPQQGLRSTLVVAYIAIALLALVPGIAAKFGMALLSQSVLASFIEQVARALADIKFGRGIRFWLGVSGATMMALLLLYPLRKVLFNVRAPGSVGGWFHVHILLGLLGPVAILYHCNFEQGGFNANVALWTMLAVAASGIVGFFVYSRVSRDFYVTIDRARQLRKSLLASLPGLDQSQPWTDQLTRDFEAFEADVLAPRQGVITSIRTRWRVEQRRRPIVQNIAAYMNQYANARSLDRDQYLALRSTTGRHLGAYFSLARSSASQSVREQAWSRWRLFHLPLFLIMLVAIVLHVVAVWGVDDVSDISSTEVFATTPASVVALKPRGAQADDPIGDLIAREKSSGGAPSPTPGTSSRREKPAQEAKTATEATHAPRLLVPPKLITTRPRPDDSPAQTTRQTVAQSSQAPAARAIGTLPQSRPPVSATAFDEPLVRSARPGAPALPAVRDVDSPVEPVRQAVGTNRDPSAAAAIAELERRIDTPMGVGMTAAGPGGEARSTAGPGGDGRTAAGPGGEGRSAAGPGGEGRSVAGGSAGGVINALGTALGTVLGTGLGGPGLRTLAEQIQHMKARMAAQQFAHSELETGFALTGKHLKAECTSCHTAPLREVRQIVARACASCHKKDDVHKGRRPQCVDCHTTNRWTQILRRK
mgnify:CR=1 FL=1